MKLSEKYRELVDTRDLNTHVQFMAFTGTVPPGPHSKSKFPAKIFGVVGQEYVSEQYLEDLADLEIDNLVVTPFDLDENCRELSDLRNVLAKIHGEDPRRIVSAMDTILESGYVFHMLDVAHAMNICAGVWSTKASQIAINPMYNVTGRECEDTLFFNMGTCVSAW